MMSSIDVFSAYAQRSTLPVSSHSLDTMMMQSLSSQPAGQVFQETAETPTPNVNAKEKFLQRYAQAIAAGQFILAYDSDPQKMCQQFAKDLALLYRLMLPAEEDKDVLKSPSMSEMEKWLIELVPTPSDEEPAEDASPADEKHFLSLAFNNFQLMYKKNWQNVFDKIKDEWGKPLVVDWDQGLAQPNWPYSDGDYTPTATGAKG